MKEFRGTPGEWRADGDEFYGWCVVSGDVVVADLDLSDQEWDIQAANAHLMAASHDLLEALQAIMKLNQEPVGNGWYEVLIDSMTINDAEAAIRKALGE